jgi:hypothetical protein
MKFHYPDLGLPDERPRRREAVGAAVSRGFEWVDSTEAAELVLLNTCSIREGRAQGLFGTRPLRESSNAPADQRHRLPGPAEQAALFKQAPTSVRAGTMA